MIDDVFDARVVAIGAASFAFAIPTDRSRAGLDCGRLRYERIDLPRDVAAGVDRFLRRLGLLYGVLEFTVDRGGRWWFGGCDACGHYQRYEAQTGAPLTETAAELLAGAPQR